MEFRRAFDSVHQDTLGVLSGETSKYFLITEGIVAVRCRMDLIMGRTIDQGFQGASFDEVRFTDLDFADEAVIFAETM